MKKRTLSKEFILFKSIPDEPAMKEKNKKKDYSGLILPDK